jgi:hypothetical protein
VLTMSERLLNTVRRCSSVSLRKQSYAIVPAVLASPIIIYVAGGWLDSAGRDSTKDIPHVMFLCIA